MFRAKELQLKQKLNFALALIGIIVAIFIADTTTDYAVASAVFYAPVILGAVVYLSAKGVIRLGGICIALTAISFAFTHSGDYKVGLVNMAISIVAIGVTVYLARRLVSAEVAEHHARRQLLRLARVISMGELSASIAHEVHQPLAAIATNAGAARRWLEQDPPLLDNGVNAIRRITADVERATKIVDRVHGMARGEEARPTAFDLNALVLELEAMARLQIESHEVVLKLDLAENLPMVWAERVQIGQVIGNLMINAIDALAASPTTPRLLRICTQQGTENGASVTVSDNGIGIAPSDMAHLFDAFWTTKKDGMGLGLTISRSIVEAHGGRLWAEPGPQSGTVFHVTLPSAIGVTDEHDAK